MKQFLFGFSFLLFVSLTGFSGELIYPSFSIPDTLLSEANAVVRDMENVLTIQSDNSASYSIYKAVTVLNEKGEEHGSFYVFYDDHRKLSGISIKIYDASGNCIQKVKSDEIKDFSAVSGFSLYEDSRVMIYEPVINSFPYTVVYQVELNYKGYIQFPVWQPQVSPDLSVQNASLTIRMQGNNEMRWYERNITTKPQIVKSGNTKEVNWKVSMIPAFKPVVFQPPMAELTPNVMVAPSDFTYDGYKGNLDTWNYFGAWIHQLLKQRDQLDEQTVSEIKSLVADAQDTVEMIRRIYKFVQAHTRYVSIQYGIGGFQPFEAEVVDRVGYGDCKALTNYTCALLRSVGIRSVYTVVNAGKYADELITDFSSQQFNHAILFVPLKKDTIWLECTDQHMPFGYLGKFTADRKALAITPDGGIFVNTESYIDHPALTSCNGMITIDENGNGLASIKLSQTGLNYDDVFSFIHQDNDFQEKWLYKNYYIPNAKIEKYTITDHPDLVPSAEIDIDLTIEKYAGKSGKRLFIPLNKIDALTATPPDNDERKFDIYIRNAHEECDSIEFVIPNGFDVEHLPAEMQLNNSFGAYSSSITVNGSHVNYVRNLKINKGRYAASEYPNLYEFYKSVVKSDKSKLVLKSNE